MDVTSIKLPISRGRLMVGLSKEEACLPKKTVTASSLLESHSSTRMESTCIAEAPINNDSTPLTSAARLFGAMTGGSMSPNLLDNSDCTIDIIDDIMLNDQSLTHETELLLDTSDIMIPLQVDNETLSNLQPHEMDEEPPVTPKKKRIRCHIDDIMLNDQTLTHETELLLDTSQIVASNITIDTENGNQIVDNIDSIDDPDYVPELSQSDSEPDESIMIPLSVDNETLSNLQPHEMDEEPPVTQKKKRIRLDSERIQRDRSSHPIRDACDVNTCKKKCFSNIPQPRRNEIWTNYWQMSYNQRRAWLFGNIDRIPKQKCTKGEHVSRRDLTYRYKLNDSDGITHIVCKTFFLTTLGYNKLNDKPVITALRSPGGSLTSRSDKRGSHQPANKIDKSAIDKHIQLFHPCVSHYRREHAPLRRYLPSDINITYMYKDFKEKHKGFKCSYDVYRAEIKRQKISFTKLGEEECETCEEFYINKHTHDHPLTNDELQNMKDDVEAINNIECERCKSWLGHVRAAKVSRKHYQKDASQDPLPNTVIRSVDMQKVIMLPRMPGQKTAVFTKRIIAFHETFAAVGKKDSRRNKENTISVLWHEAIAGRKQEELASTFVMALEHERDLDHVVYWLDNCAGQNKNWCLFSTLVSVVNGTSISAKDITLKYFERGHTFMSADSFHHGVEKEMARQPGGKVYDFEDFIRVVGSSNTGHVDVLQLKPDNIPAWVGGQSAAKLKKPRALLSTIVQVQVRRDSKLLHYKLSHEDDRFQQFDFLKKTFSFERPAPLLNGPRGISVQKKRDIVDKLCPLMPENRRAFWNNLNTNDGSADD